MPQGANCGGSNESMDMEGDDRTFICPECGSTEATFVAHVSTHYDPNNPWSAVLERITCAQCRYEIPAHVAQRWENMSIEEAQREWREIYRADAPRQKRKRT